MVLSSDISVLMVCRTLGFASEDAMLTDGLPGTACGSRRGRSLCGRQAAEAGRREAKAGRLWVHISLRRNAHKHKSFPHTPDTHTHAKKMETHTDVCPRLMLTCKQVMEQKIDDGATMNEPSTSSALVVVWLVMTEDVDRVVVRRWYSSRLLSTWLRGVA